MARRQDRPTPVRTTAAAAAAALTLVAAAPPARAGDAATLSPSPYRVEGGARYWYSTGSSTKNLYDSTGSLHVSKLTYDGLDAHAGEVYFRGEHAPTGMFAKGNLGIGATDDGSLIDEDFPPVTTPYSRTSSAQHGGSLGYATIDLGYDFRRTPRYDLGAFVGYNYYHEELAAYGCRQRAGSGICDPAITSDVAVIEQENDWHSLRLGLSGRLRPTERLTLSVDAAVVYSYLDGEDRHLLRPSINPAPEDGDGPGAQLQAVLDYRLTDRLHLGVGARYWRFTADGYTHFEQTPGGGSAQVNDWTTERYGVFVQAGWTFD